jgi:hypothetical protein
MRNNKEMDEIGGINPLNPSSSSYERIGKL